MDADHTQSNLFYMAAARPELMATGNAEWDRRFADYLRWDGLQRADIGLGRYAAAQEVLARTEARLKSEYGKGYQSVPKGNAEWEAAWDAVTAAEGERLERYLLPLWEAARKLAVTPAPNLACALFKIELAKREELHLDSEMPGDIMSLITADMAHLSTGGE